MAPIPRIAVASQAIKILAAALTRRSGIVAEIGGASVDTTSPPQVLDLRTYRCASGKRDEFVRLMAEGTVPMLRRDGIEVVSFGPSLHDDDHAYLIRFFESVPQVSTPQPA